MSAKSSMKFVAGAPLTKEIRKTIAQKSEVKIAVAYWGSKAIDLLGLKPRRKNIEIICCLNGGKSDPKVIKLFGKRARQNDRLHAKVIWTPSAAIVSSANASSNGMPEEEEYLSQSLIEAGLYVTDEHVLAKIGSWFDSEFKKAAGITKADLKRAEDARRKRLWGKKAETVPRPSLIQSIKEGKKEFGAQRIYFMLYKNVITRSRQRQADQWARNNAKQIRKKAAIPNLPWKSLWYYQQWKVPKDAFLIDIYCAPKRATVYGPFKTFPIRLRWENIDYALKGKDVKFAYQITAEDRKVLRSASKDLWRLAYRKDGPGFLSLDKAAPVLLRHAD